MDVINLYGGPGCGKSTVAAATFAQLKQQGYNAELLREPFKAGIWDGYTAGLEDSVWITGLVYHELMQYCRGGAEVVVTDCPLLLGRVYAVGDSEATLRIYLLELAGRFRNLDVLVRRSPIDQYEQAGRAHDLDTALLVDLAVEREIGRMFTVSVGDHSVNYNATCILAEYERKRQLWDRR